MLCDSRKAACIVSRCLGRYWKEGWELDSYPDRVRLSTIIEFDMEHNIELIISQAYANIKERDREAAEALDMVPEGCAVETPSAS